MLDLYLYLYYSAAAAAASATTTRPNTTITYQYSLLEQLMRNCVFTWSTISQISSRSSLKWRSLRLFLKSIPSRHHIPKCLDSTAYGARPLPQLFLGRMTKFCAEWRKVWVLIKPRRRSYKTIAVLIIKLLIIKLICLLSIHTMLERIKVTFSTFCASALCKLIIISAEERGYVYTSVCLSVCLHVVRQITGKIVNGFWRNFL